MQDIRRVYRNGVYDCTKLPLAWGYIGCTWGRMGVLGTAGFCLCWRTRRKSLYSVEYKPSMRMHIVRGRAHASSAVALGVAGHMPRARGCRPRPSSPRSSPHGLPRPAAHRPTMSFMANFRTAKYVPMMSSPAAGTSAQLLACEQSKR